MMALATDFQDDGRTLLLSGSGVLTGREIIHAKESLLTQQERVRSITRAMVLFTDVTVLDVSPDEIRQVVGLDQQLARLAPHVAVAIVAPRDYMFGLARSWEALVDSAGWQTGVFQSLPDAEAWLKAVQSTPG
jgi:hypothetical protein